MEKIGELDNPEVVGGGDGVNGVNVKLTAGATGSSDTLDPKLRVQQQCVERSKGQKHEQPQPNLSIFMEARVKETRRSSYRRSLDYNRMPFFRQPDNYYANGGILAG
jgi:hypothetical protein